MPTCKGRKRQNRGRPISALPLFCFLLEAAEQRIINDPRLLVHLSTCMHLSTWNILYTRGDPKRTTQRKARESQGPAQ